MRTVESFIVKVDTTKRIEDTAKNSKKKHVNWQSEID